MARRRASGSWWVGLLSSALPLLIGCSAGLARHSGEYGPSTTARWSILGITGTRDGLSAGDSAIGREAEALDPATIEALSGAIVRGLLAAGGAPGAPDALGAAVSRIRAEKLRNEAVGP